MNYQQAIEAVNGGARIRRTCWENPWEHVLHISRIQEDQRAGYDPPPSGLIVFDMVASLEEGWDILLTYSFSPQDDDLVAEDWEVLRDKGKNEEVTGTAGK